MQSTCVQPTLLKMDVIKSWTTCQLWLMVELYTSSFLICDILVLSPLPLKWGTFRPQDGHVPRVEPEITPTTNTKESIYLALSVFSPKKIVLKNRKSTFYVPNLEKWEDGPWWPEVKYSVLWLNNPDPLRHWVCSVECELDGRTGWQAWHFTAKPIRTQFRINLADEPEFAIVNKANLLTGA